MNSPKTKERRYFPRINYRAHATLITTKQKWPVHILDLSFSGALAAIIHKNNIQDGEEIVLAIDIGGGKKLKMQGHVSHQNEHLFGIECRASGIDNQTTLRELLGQHMDPDQQRRSVYTMVTEHADESSSSD